MSLRKPVGFDYYFYHPVFDEKSETYRYKHTKEKQVRGKDFTDAARALGKKILAIDSARNADRITVYVSPFVMVEDGLKMDGTQYYTAIYYEQSIEELADLVVETLADLNHPQNLVFSFCKGRYHLPNNTVIRSI